MAASQISYATPHLHAIACSHWDVAPARNELHFISRLPGTKRLRGS